MILFLVRGLKGVCAQCIVTSQSRSAMESAQGGDVRTGKQGKNAITGGTHGAICSLTVDLNFEVPAFFRI